MLKEDTLERWGYTLDNHQHYSPAVQAATHAFQIAYATFQALKKTTALAAVEQSYKCQTAWDTLAKLRKQETGYATYLNPTQYKEAINELAG